MLKILHLDTGKELRGGQWQLLALAQGLRKRDHHQVIACPRGSPLHGRVCGSGFEAFPLVASGAWDLRGVLRLRRLIRRHSFQIIHAHDGRAQNLAWAASAGLPVRRVASRRVAFVSNRAVHRLKYRLMCDGVIAVSEFVRKLLVESGIPGERIAVIPDGVEWPETLQTGSQRRMLRAKWRLADQDFVIGHMGAFAPEKGQKVVIEALRLLTGALPQVALLLAGDGPWRKVLEQQCEARGARNVRFLGYVDDRAAFFNVLDLFVMPSSSEGLGSSALLAMAYGLPVIASRTGGLTEIVDQDKTGWLVEPGSPSALAQAITNAVSAAERLTAMGLDAREKARAFTNDIMTARTEAFYCRLIGTSDES